MDSWGASHVRPYNADYSHALPTNFEQTSGRAVSIRGSTRGAFILNIESIRSFDVNVGTDTAVNEAFDPIADCRGENAKSENANARLSGNGGMNSKTATLRERPPRVLVR